MAAEHNQVIADIILEIKRSPAIVSEQRYNEWYTRILDEMDKKWTDEDMIEAYCADYDGRKPFVDWIAEYKRKKQKLNN